MFYRINIVPAWKPWRGGENPHYTTDPKVFDWFNTFEDTYGYQVDDRLFDKTEDDFNSYEEYEEALESFSEEFFDKAFEQNVEFPITIIDECWVYTE